VGLKLERSTARWPEHDKHIISQVIIRIQTYRRHKRHVNFDVAMDGQLLEPTLYTIKGIAILDNDGNRILAKYYDKNVFPTSKEQKTFEKNLFNKTHRANAEIIMLDGLTCVYKSNVDLFFYVMGSNHENELILMSVLNCLYESVSHILRKNVEKRAVLDSLDIVMLALDEICDGGFYNQPKSS
ncbi:hypothetical protein TSAR_010421, partial [Trichomalopsis sarcophagae]